MATEELPQFVGPCSRCHAVSVGAWPHPLGEPCPIVVRESEAYVAMLNAQREYYSAQSEYYLQSQMPLLDVGEMARTITKEMGGGED